MRRRDFLKTSAAAIGSSIVAPQVLSMPKSENASQTLSALIMPDESEPHERTWMAFVANPEIWSVRQVPRVKQDLALIANTIAQYEPVSLLLAPDDREEAEALLDLSSSRFPIELIEFAVDDLWLRDTGPVFVRSAAGEKVAIDFNFNGWGNKQRHSRDAKVAQFIARRSGAWLQNTELVLEGGCFEVDGQGAAILTKSCILNDNRNPGWTQREVEAELSALLGLKKIVWLEGVKGKDITDGHTDFYARFTHPGEVLVSRDNYRESFDYEITRDNIQVLSRETGLDGRPLALSIIDTPDQINERYGTRDFAAGYIGYYVCNGAVIAQKFGDAHADAQARKILARAFPDRVIEQIAIDGIASGGGSIHCATQQEIKV